MSECLCVFLGAGDEDRLTGEAGGKLVEGSGVVWVSVDVGLSALYADDEERDPGEGEGGFLWGP